MKHKVPWNRTLLEDFMCMLEENAGSPEEVQIIKKYRKKIGEI